MTDYLPVFTSLNIVQNLERQIVKLDAMSLAPASAFTGPSEVRSLHLNLWLPFLPNESQIAFWNCIANPDHPCRRTGRQLVSLTTGPETAPEEKSQSARIVQTIPVVGQTRHIAVSAYGSVVPSRKVVIRPQVSGQVIRQSENMAVGGQFYEGDELRIDPQDYELALAAVRSDLEQARFEREVESGRQVIAQREWDELQSGLDIEEVNRSLVLGNLTCAGPKQ